MVRDTISLRDTIVSLGSPDKVLAMNLFRIYFRGSSADDSSTFVNFPGILGETLDEACGYFSIVNNRMNS